MISKTPLVSLCITCFNQARYIGDSLQSAFDQTYTPLEIVISDDCSSDETNSIIEKMISEYRLNRGVHRIVYNKNEHTLYVARNYEKAFRMANGELLVTGAGDDISEPNRVQHIVDQWMAMENDGKSVSCMLHAWLNIDEDGKRGGVSGPWGVRTPLGAAATYSRKVFSLFPPLVGECKFYEDDIFTLRALAVGDVVMVHEPLVRYRSTSGLSHVGSFRHVRSKMASSVIRACEQFNKELGLVGGTISKEKRAYVKRIVEWKLMHYSAELKLCSGTFLDRVNGFREMKSADGKTFWEMRQYAMMVLPSPIGKLIQKLISLVKIVICARVIQYGKHD